MGLSQALSTMLVCALGLFVASLAVMLWPRHAHRPRTLERLVLPVAAVAAGAMVGTALLGGGPGLAATTAVVLGGSLVAVATLVHGWSTRGVVVAALGLDVAGLYLAYTTTWLLDPGHGAVGSLAGVLQVVLQAVVLLLAAGFLHELVDHASRRLGVPGIAPEDSRAAHRPFVSLHVPTSDVDPGVVLTTLHSLTRLDPGDHEVIVVDHSTDESDWRPLEQLCSRFPQLRFIHLAQCPGGRAGALNEALRRTDPRAEVLAVVEPGLTVSADYLTRCAPLLTGDVALVRTPVGHEGAEHSGHLRRLAHLQGFLDGDGAPADDIATAVGRGAQLLLSRSAVELAGGWDEWCSTPEVELALRLMKAGGRPVGVATPFAVGLLPSSFEELKQQRYRWSFGGVQVLRLHWRSLMPWDVSAHNHLSARQRWSFLSLGLQWFGDVAVLALTALLSLSALDLLVGEGVVVDRLAGLLAVCVAAVAVLGLTRAVSLLRHQDGSSVRDRAGAITLWTGLTWVVALGALRGMSSLAGARPSAASRPRAPWRAAVVGSPAESLLVVATLTLAVAGAAVGTPAGWLLGGLLLWQSAGFALAPLHGYAAARARLPRPAGPGAPARGPRRDPAPAVSLLARQVRRGVVWPVVGAGALSLALVTTQAPSDNPIDEILRPPTAEVAARVVAAPQVIEARAQVPSLGQAASGDPTAQDTLSPSVRSRIAQERTSAGTRPAPGGPRSGGPAIKPGPQAGPKPGPKSGPKPGSKTSQSAGGGQGGAGKTPAGETSPESSPKPTTSPTPKPQPTSKPTPEPTAKPDSPTPTPEPTSKPGKSDDKPGKGDDKPGGGKAGGHGAGDKTGPAEGPGKGDPDGKGA